MNDEIKVGDLVMVVKPKTCCGSPKSIGRIHTVTGFYEICQCDACGYINHTTCAMVDGKHEARPLSVLKKINPPPIKESIEREVTA